MTQVCLCRCVFTKSSGWKRTQVIVPVTEPEMNDFNVEDVGLFGGAGSDTMTVFPGEEIALENLERMFAEW